VLGGIMTTENNVKTDLSTEDNEFLSRVGLWCGKDAKIECQRRISDDQSINREALLREMQKKQYDTHKESFHYRANLKCGGYPKFDLDDE